MPYIPQVSLAFLYSPGVSLWVTKSMRSLANYNILSGSWDCVLHMLALFYLIPLQDGCLESMEWNTGMTKSESKETLNDSTSSFEEI